MATRRLAQTALLGFLSIVASAQTPSSYVAVQVAGARYAHEDGPVATARFEKPGSLAFDSQGNLFVADTGSNTVRRISADGIVSTLAGIAGLSAAQDGDGGETSFSTPGNLAVDSDGTVYLTTVEPVIRKIDATGHLTTAVDSPEIGTNLTDGVAVDSAKRIYYTQYLPPLVRRKTIGQPVTNYAGQTYFGFVGEVYSQPLNALAAIAMDRDDSLYLALFDQVLKLSSLGVVTTVGSGIPSFTQARMIAPGAAGVFVAEESRLHYSTGTGPFTSLLTLDPTIFQTFTSLATDPQGTLHATVTDALTTKIQKWNGSQLADVAGGRRKRDGGAETALFSGPAGMAFDRDGNLIVADSRNSAVRKIDKSGMVTTLAENTASAPLFEYPWGIAIDTAGNIFVSDSLTAVVIKIAPTGAASIFAGSLRSSGSVDGQGSAARFNAPGPITIDGNGNLYVLEQYRLRKISPQGVVSSIPFEGTSGFSSAAAINGITAGDDGDLYAVMGSGIVKVTPSGEVSIVAGSSITGNVDGIGSEARFSDAHDICRDAQGNLYVLDVFGIRQITPEGVVATLWTDSPRIIFDYRRRMQRDPSGAFYVSLHAASQILKIASGNVAPVFQTQPRHRVVKMGNELSFQATARGAPTPSVQWLHNGREISGATAGTLTVSATQPSDSGIYQALATSGSSRRASANVIAGIMTTGKVAGAANEIAQNVRHPNGNVFDQVLLSGAAASITADYSLDPAKNQITRLSYVDLNDDIVQVEFSGPGTLSILLASSSGPAAPLHYNQAIDYMKGHAGIVIVGATERTNVSVFSVGRSTAVNPALFKDDVHYNGLADLAFIAISSANGRFGGVRASNASFYATTGITGLYAPGVVFEGPVYVGNISAFDDAMPVFELGYAADARITGGDLFQTNGQPVQVGGVKQLQFTAGSDSHDNLIARKTNRAVLVKNREDVTSALVVYP
jgi:sugar lactone lactonase YvrE